MSICRPQWVIAAVMLGLVALLGLALLAGCSSGSGGTPQPRDPWKSAGVDRPETSARETADGTVLTVRAQTSLPLPDEANRVSFARRAAKIVWRNHKSRFDMLDLSTGDGRTTHSSTWRRTDLERSFGPRPDGLDAGRGPARLAASPGPYHGLRVNNLEPAATLMSELLTRTAHEHLQQPAAMPETGLTTECFDGFLGDKPTGRSQAEFALKLTLPAGGEAEARLPALAAYWAGLGLDVDTDDLDTGLGSFRASMPGVGGASVLTFAHDNGQDPARRMLLRAHTDCHKP
jgi:hypothetical protein